MNFSVFVHRGAMQSPKNLTDQIGQRTLRGYRMSSIGKVQGESVREKLRDLSS